MLSACATKIMMKAPAPTRTESSIRARCTCGGREVGREGGREGGRGGGMRGGGMRGGGWRGEG